jgi:Tol biopolymer transport system component
MTFGPERRFRPASLALLLLTLPLLSAPVVAQEAAEPAVSTARLAAPPGNRRVEAVRPFLPGGGRIAFARQGDWIAYDKVGDDGFYDLHLRQLEGGRSEKCLTCDDWRFRKANAFDPVWHPSGEYLIFRVQQNARRLDLDPRRLAGPARGLHADLWVMDRDGKNTYQLTRSTEQGGAVVEPHFSYEGNRLVWTDRLENVTKPWGEWGFRVAEIERRRGVVRLGKVRTLRPPVAPGFTLAHGFTPDERGLWISALSSPRDERSREVLRFDLENETVENLSHTRAWREGTPAVAPRDSDLLAWVSDRGLDASEGLPYLGDLWLRDARTGDQERLTFFNDPDSDHNLGQALIDDVTWSPDGDRILLHVVSLGTPAKRRVVVKPGESIPPPVPAELEEGIWVVELVTDP